MNLHSQTNCFRFEQHSFVCNNIRSWRNLPVLTGCINKDWIGSNQCLFVIDFWHTTNWSECEEIQLTSEKYFILWKLAIRSVLSGSAIPLLILSPTLPPNKFLQRGIPAFRMFTLYPAIHPPAGRRGNVMLCRSSELMVNWQVNKTNSELEPLYCLLLESQHQYKAHLRWSVCWIQVTDCIVCKLCSHIIRHLPVATLNGLYESKINKGFIARQTPKTMFTFTGMPVDECTWWSLDFIHSSPNF